MPFQDCTFFSFLTGSLPYQELWSLTVSLPYQEYWSLKGSLPYQEHWSLTGSWPYHNFQHTSSNELAISNWKTNAQFCLRIFLYTYTDPE